MHPIIQRAEILLQSHAHPTLRLTELLRLLRRDVDQSLTETRLRTVIGEHPGQFRVLESWQGGWRHIVSGAEPATWIVAVGQGAPPPKGAPPAYRLRESVRWLGCGIDARSRTDATRWYAIALTERATRQAFIRRAASNDEGAVPTPSSRLNLYSQPEES